MAEHEMEAYVHLLPNANEYGGGWRVVDIGSIGAENLSMEQRAENQDFGGAAFTDKRGRRMGVPHRQFVHDAQVRAHEMIHAKRHSTASRYTCDRATHGKAGHVCNVWRDMMVKMLEEVAIDAVAINEDLDDLRSARNVWDYATWPAPKDEYHAVIEYLQIWSTYKSGQAKPALIEYVETKVQPMIEAAHLEAVERAADGVWYDYRESNVDVWADYLAAQFVPVKTEPEKGTEGSEALKCPACGSTDVTVKVIADHGGGLVDIIMECNDCGAVTTALAQLVPGGTSDGKDAIKIQAVQSVKQPAGRDGNTPLPTESPQGADDGLGEDDEEDSEDGSEKDGQAGTDGEDSDDLDTGSGLEDEEDGTSGGEAGSNSLRQYPARDVNEHTPHTLDPKSFGADPLAREHNLLDGEPIHPPEIPRMKREREIITRAELQAQLDQEQAQRRMGLGSQSEHLDASTPYGNVDVHRHTFSRVTTKTVSAAWRSNDAGSVLRFPQNLHTTGRIYGVKGRGGTIVMDGSGSMAWHDDIVIAAMESGELPNLTVARAYYHGFSYHNPKTQKAGNYVCRLCIVAQNGRYSMDDPREEPETTGANSGMDPAALAYAAKYLPKPIVWVSDGMVGGNHASGFAQQCDSVMRQYRIVRVIVLEDAIGYLKGNAVIGWYQAASVNTSWVRLGGQFNQSNSSLNSWEEARKWAQLRSTRRTESY